MYYLKKLEDELIFINQLISEIERNSSIALEGTLRVSKNGKYYAYYYHKKEDNERYHNGRYLKKSEMKLAADLAQQEYDEKILAWAYGQKDIIERLLKNHDMCGASKILVGLPEGKRILIKPYVLTNDEFAKKWQKEAFVSRNYKPEDLLYTTERGEMVRSKSEKIIADKLFKLGIPYKYECPLYLNDGSCLIPDFTILNVRTRDIFYWEHFGMVDDPSYSDGMVKKLHRYNNNGIFIGNQLIVTMEGSKSFFDLHNVELQIKEYLL